MKNIIKYIGLLLIFVFLAYIVTRKDKSSNVVWHESFAYNDTSSIDKIFLSDKSGKQIILERKNGNWIVNGQYIAMQSKINNLLTTIREVRISHPVPYAAHDNVVKQLSTSGVKVEVYSNDSNIPVKTYYVGGPNNEHTGTYMIMTQEGEIAKRPYVTHIPGFVGFLTPRYFVDEHEWRDLNIFRLTMNEIQSVKIAYPMTPEHSFSLISVNADSFAVEPLAAGVPNNETALYKPGISKFLTSFENKNAEALENSYPGKDTILKTTPYALVEVKDNKGEVKKMTVYYMPVDRRSKVDESADALFDTDRYFATINNGKDFVIIQHYVFGDIFRRYNDFFTRPTGQSPPV